MPHGISAVILQGAAMRQLQLSTRIYECEQNGWSDLISNIDGITQSLIDNPSAGKQIVNAMKYWQDSVDCRTSSLPPDELEVMLQNPVMNITESFGTEV